WSGTGAPARFASLSVAHQPGPTTGTGPENRLSDVFETIVKGMYGNQPDFEMRSPVVESTGNIVIEWKSTVIISNKKLKFQASSKMQRVNNKFAILTFGVIEPKFTEMKDAFAKISNSQMVNASLAIP
ncbi:MAG: hypothetical protein ACKPCM_04895, partial [Pseudanabaena sp.]